MLRPLETPTLEFRKIFGNPNLNSGSRRIKQSQSGRRRSFLTVHSSSNTTTTTVWTLKIYYGGYLEITQKVIEGGICHVMAYASDFEMAQNSNHWVSCREIEFNVRGGPWDGSKSNRRRYLSREGICMRLWVGSKSRSRVKTPRWFKIRK